ncbi:ArsR family transcriptional regulator [Halomicroarcula sp. F28]|uniref:ArsR family transcriptional regulator n=1 Tax=Haloarcula salinisoli TaxID=2487746 RepID=UPI001C735570|nr:ArsR family transcriptional regulator [Halomicroarcula salinisoli]
MRLSGSWQSVWDDRILEWMRENEGTGTPKEIHDSGLVRVSRTQIGRRMKKLAEHHLLTHVGNGAYVITDEGEAYLEEEYDAEEGVYLKDNGPSASSTSEAETNDV